MGVLPQNVWQLSFIQTIAVVAGGLNSQMNAHLLALGGNKFTVLSLLLLITLQ